MNINGVSKTISIVNKDKNNKGEISDFNNKLNNILKNNSKLDEYIPEKQSDGLEKNDVYGMTENEIQNLNTSLLNNNLNKYCRSKEEADPEISTSIDKAKVKEISQKLGNKEVWEEIFQNLDKENSGSSKADSSKSASQSDIVVKPDGSRVLIITTKIGGMEMTMSLEISKPTNAPNEKGKNNEVNNNKVENNELEKAEINSDHSMNIDEMSSFEDELIPQDNLQSISHSA